MDAHAMDGPGDDLPDLWIVHLNESFPPPTPPSPHSPLPDEPSFLLFEGDDPPSDLGFHPRLRRFDEAA
jgi:hypothetical protein